MTLKRMMMTVLMMLTVSAMSAEQKIWLRYSSGGKAKISLDGKGLELDKENKATVKDAAGLKVAVTATPDDGYTVSSVTAQLSVTLDDGNSKTRGADDASFLEVTKESDTEYVFTMPDAGYNVVVNVNFTVESSRKGGDLSGITIKGGDFSGTYFIKSVSVNKETTDDYYLCPTEGWVYYTGTNSFTEEDNGQPFLTTYPCKSIEGYNATKALWKIEKSGNYYTIKHVIDGKYMVYNGQISDANANRIRVHLADVETLGENELFVIGTNTAGNIVISPKNASTNYFNVCQGNIKDLAGSTKYKVKAKNDGPTTPTNHKNDIHGTIGLYTDINDSNAPFILEDYITRPTIDYDVSDNNKIIITNKTTSLSGTIYYTTNGDDPTLEASTRSSFTDASKTIDSFTDGTIIKAVAKVGNDYSNVVTFTSFVHVGNSNQYLIQTVDGGSFYMVPPITTETKVTTTNIPHEKMAWYFDYVGQEWGIQYYNIVNVKTSSYLYCSGSKGSDGAFKLKEDSETDANRYTFVFVSSGDGVNVIPNIHFAETTGMCMSKKNGNNATDNLNLSDGTDNNSRWKFVALPSDSDPKTLFDRSFASTSSGYKSYEIQSASATTTHLVPPATVGGNLTANTTGDNPVWSFEDTGESDTWISYYYLRNRTTGNYVFFDGTAGQDNGSTFFTSATITSGSEDKFKFIVVKATNGTSYNIIPKLLKDQANQTKNSLSKTSTTELKTLNSRAVEASLWNLVETNTFTVLPPTIAYGTGVVSMSSVTPGAVIKYTTSTTDPSTIYDDANKPAYADDAQIYIKALAAVGNNTSSDVTFIKNPDVNFTEGFDFSYTGSAIEPTVSSVTVTPEGGSAITIDETEYEIAYSNNTNVGKATITISDALPANNLIISGISEFDITKRSLGDGTTAADGIVITVTKVEDTPISYTVTVKNGTSITLVEDTDYTLNDVTSDASGYRATITAVENSNYSGGAKIIFVKADFPTATDPNSGGAVSAYQATTDLATPPGLTAYIVTGINLGTSTVEVKKVDYIPNGKPVLLLTDEGDPHDADFTTSLVEGVTDEQRNTDTEGNLLKISTSAEPVACDWGQYYIFSKGEFVLSMGGKTMMEGLFYLDNSEYSSGGGSTRNPSILHLSRGATTVINGVVSQKEKDSRSSVWYTIDGQKLNQKPTRKGIYIYHGHKIIIK
jgi:hypothetical protein